MLHEHVTHAFISIFNIFQKLINITEKHIDELAQDNATNQRGSLYEISYVFEQRLTDYARLHVHAKSVRKETSDFGKNNLLIALKTV